MTEHTFGLSTIEQTVYINWDFKSGMALSQLEEKLILMPYIYAVFYNLQSLWDPFCHLSVTVTLLQDKKDTYYYLH